MIFTLFILDPIIFKVSQDLGCYNDGSSLLFSTLFFIQNNNAFQGTQDYTWSQFVFRIIMRYQGFKTTLRNSRFLDCRTMTFISLTRKYRRYSGHKLSIQENVHFLLKNLSFQFWTSGFIQLVHKWDSNVWIYCFSLRMTLLTHDMGALCGL